jgi:hypothetical protein
MDAENAINLGKKNERALEGVSNFDGLHDTTTTHRNRSLTQCLPYSSSSSATLCNGAQWMNGPFGPCQWLTQFLHGLKAGDFGQIDPETGQFVREGNIYQDEPLASIAKDYPPETTEPIYELKIDSGSTTRMSTLP